MTTSTPPKIFDRARLARNRDKAAADFEKYAFLKDRVSSDLIDRLNDTAHTFPNALDIGSHDGRLAAALERSEKVSTVLATDISRGMLHQAAKRGLETQQIDEEHLTLPAASVDLAVSALSLHWVNDLPGTLVQIRNALKPDGLFLGALFGAGTLTELRNSLIEAETELRGGISPRLSPLPALADMAALMQRAGFALPVVDRDTVTVRYADPFALLRDLKGMGERASFMPGTGQPLSRSVLLKALDIYRQTFADPDGRIRATFEIIHVSGWAPHPAQPKPLKPGSAKASLREAVQNFGEKTPDD